MNRLLLVRALIRNPTSSKTFGRLAKDSTYPYSVICSMNPLVQIFYVHATLHRLAVYRQGVKPIFL